MRLIPPPKNPRWLVMRVSAGGAVRVGGYRWRWAARLVAWRHNWFGDGYDRYLYEVCQYSQRFKYIY